MKICSKCKEEKDPSDFSPKSSWCKLCKSKAEAERRLSQGIQPKIKPIVTEITKECCTCKTQKSLEEFYPSERGRLGLASDCKSCISIKSKTEVRREKHREYTKKYREENREEYLANHRIHQYKRKTQQEVLSDGTVDTEFVKSIYTTENCYYCNQYIEVCNRTLEHKNPLSKGGSHSKNNIEMACTTCNCSKRDLTEEEFKQRLNANFS